MSQLELGNEGHLRVTRATVGVKQQVGFDGGVGAISLLASANAADDSEKSRVICLMNMVTSDELINDEEYEGKFFRLFLVSKPTAMGMSFRRSFPNPKYTNTKRYSRFFSLYKVK